MRYFLKVKYFGATFHGSQIQGDVPTVQLAINKALSTIMGKNVASYGASRTDEGVHALVNYYHFDSDKVLDKKFQYKLNAILPFEISVEGIYLPLNQEGNARFDAISRRYRYKIYNKKNPFLQKRGLFYPYKINRAILNETAEILKSYTDFESFSKRNTQSKTFICNINNSFWEDHNTELHYVVEANRFLRGMVRAFVTTQLKVARGLITTEQFKQIILDKDCTKADFSATGFGLYLEEIAYPENYFQKLEMD